MMACCWLSPWYMYALCLHVIQSSLLHLSAASASAFASISVRLDEINDWQGTCTATLLSVKYTVHSTSPDPVSAYVLRLKQQHHTTSFLHPTAI